MSHDTERIRAFVTIIAFAVVAVVVLVIVVIAVIIVGQREREKSGHGKNQSERGTLTSWREQVDVVCMLDRGRAHRRV